MRIAILGGTGAMGRFIARELRDDGHEVVITGSNPHTAERVARELDVEAAPTNVDAAKDADVVVVSVPISVTEDVIREVAPHIPEGSLLTDVTSVKARPVRAMLEHAPEGVYVLGTHPLFGPTVPSLRGQTIILTPTGRSGPWTRRVRRYLERKGARVVETTPEEHDRTMAVVQCLTHAVLLAAGAAIGRFLPSLELDIEEVASPVYRLLMDVVGRIVGQDPRLYAEIQAFNPYGDEAREELLRALRRLHELAHDHDALTEYVAESRERLSRELDLEACQRRTDKLLSYLADELRILQEGIEAILLDVYTNEAFEGEVTGDRDTVRLGDRELPRDRYKVLPRRPKELAHFNGKVTVLEVCTSADPEDVAAVVDALGRNLRALGAERHGERVRVEIEYDSEESLERLLQRLRALGLNAHAIR
ncbi:prephenate dehydrogenase [Methanopyrus sp.]